MSNPFLAEVRIVGWGFAARGWALSNGQILPINQNQALFALLGTNFGGDGRTTFALPNMQGRVPMHVGQGSGLTARALASYGGVEFVTQQTAQVPGSPVSPVQAAVKLQTQVQTISPFIVLNFMIALQGIFPSRN
jgi:microcystin-dependent protein